MKGKCGRKKQKTVATSPASRYLRGPGRTNLAITRFTHPPPLSICPSLSAPIACRRLEESLRTATDRASSASRKSFTGVETTSPNCIFRRPGLRKSHASSRQCSPSSLDLSKPPVANARQALEFSERPESHCYRGRTTAAMLRTCAATLY